jgi:DNA polymerase III subunit gamma/tau
MITVGTHPDVIEMDAASDSGVDDVREKIVEVVSYAPMMAKYKVFIIDEVHDLSAKAFDALLKTVEEPPSHLVFILATTEFNKVPATIRSRCQKYEFHRATIKHLTDRLQFVCSQEGVTSEPAAIAAIARMADGGFRDALTLLEQAILVSDGSITVDVVYDQLGLVSETAVDELLLAIQASDVPKVINTLESVTRSGRDPRALLESMLHRLADLTRASYQVLGNDTDATRESLMHEISTRLGRDFLVSTRSALAEAHKVIRDISLPRLWLESELIRLTTQGSLPVVQVAVAPRSVSTTPKSEPRPVAQTAVVQPVIISPESSTPSESGQAEVEQQEKPAPKQHRDDWDRLLDALPMNPNTGSPTPHKMRLKGSQLIEDSGEKLLVAIERQTDLDWFNERPDRIKFLLDRFADIGRHGTTIEFVVEKKNDVRLNESEAVELPVEGARLERIVRDVFNVPDSKELEI